MGAKAHEAEILGPQIRLVHNIIAGFPAAGRSGGSRAVFDDLSYERPANPRFEPFIDSGLESVADFHSRR